MELNFAGGRALQEEDDTTMAINVATQSGQASAGQHAVDPRSGKYLIFELGKEEFGTSVMKVKEIMKMQEITVVPQTPAFVQGVINLRGRIVPVINLRRKFDMPDQEDTARTCIIVVRVEQDGVEQPIGIVVDGVVEVLMVAAEDIEDTPDFGYDVKTSYVSGIAKSKVNGKVKILLDIDRILSSQELHGLAGVRP